MATLKSMAAILGVVLCPWMTHAQSVTEASVQTSLTQDIKPSKWNESTWSLGSGVESRREGKDDGFATVVRFETKFQYGFTNWLRLEASPYASFFSSRVQERFADDTYDNRFGLSYGHLTLLPIDDLKFKLGAISQESIDNRQMISSFRSFPGGAVDYRHQVIQSLTLGAEIQYVIPTSSSLNTERQDREKLPSLQTQALVLEYKPQGLEVKAKGGAFAWDNLPAKVALESTRAGNIPANGDLDAETRFRYGFSGWFANLDSTVNAFDVSKVGLHFKRFQNTDAPSNFSDSQYTGLSAETPIGGALGLKLAVGQFFAEAHATPALYASSGLGNTNREGQVYEAKLDFKDYQFFISGEYVTSDVINASVYQDSMSNFSIMVESYEFTF